MRIDALTRALPNAAETTKNAATEGSGNDFGDMLMDALKEVNQSQSDAKGLQNAFMAGQPAVEIHDVMIAMEKASVAMQLTMTVRNKVLEAYQEISRMQV